MVFSALEGINTGDRVQKNALFPRLSQAGADGGLFIDGFNDAGRV